jgi:hypothetical protein
MVVDIEQSVLCYELGVFAGVWVAHAAGLVGSDGCDDDEAAFHRLVVVILVIVLGVIVYPVHSFGGKHRSVGVAILLLLPREECSSSVAAAHIGKLASTWSEATSLRASSLCAHQ